MGENPFKMGGLLHMWRILHALFAYLLNGLIKRHYRDFCGVKQKVLHAYLELPFNPFKMGGNPFKWGGILQMWNNIVCWYSFLSAI